MTLKTFFTGRAIVFGILLILLGIGAVLYRTFVTTEAPEPVVQQPQPEQSVPTEPPVVRWQFAESDQFDLDGLPQTEVTLVAQYADGTVRTIPVDTKPGSCNEIEGRDTDLVQNTVMAQCYAAGLGYRYKITPAEGKYLVQRKASEEALPDYEPPQYEYEVVAEIPFARQ